MGILGAHTKKYRREMYPKKIIIAKTWRHLVTEFHEKFIYNQAKKFIKIIKKSLALSLPGELNHTQNFHNFLLHSIGSGFERTRWIF